MGLLLTFFVLLASFSGADTSAYSPSLGVMKTVQTGMYMQYKKREYIFTPPVITDINQFATSTEIPDSSSQDDTDKMRSSLGALTREIQSDIISVEMQGKDVVITIKNPLFFKTAKADLEKDYSRILQKIMTVITSTKYKILVKGFTDRLPIMTEKYPSNWELSVARAFSVVEYFTLKQGVDPGRFIIAGFGDSRASEAADPARERALNRKIQIVLMPE